MLSDLQKFLDNCKTIDRILSTDYEDASELHMACIGDAFTFEEIPKLLTFVVADDDNIPRILKIVVSVELMREFGQPPIQELIATANRYKTKNIENNVYFLHPEIKDSIVFRGHEINPIKNPPITVTNLVQSIRDLPMVESVSAHKIVDSKIKEQLQCNNPIIINWKHTEFTRTINVDGNAEHLVDEYPIFLTEKEYKNPALFGDILKKISNDVWHQI
jgi:hypothetical protein